MAKRGPKSEKGKAVAKMNAVRHGVLASTAVIPGLEGEDEWEEHRICVLVSLGAEGYLEEIVADLIALLWWKLARLDRWERDKVAGNLERVDQDLAHRRRYGAPRSIEDAKEAVHRAREHLRLLQRFSEIPDDAPLSPDDADTLMCALLESREDGDLDSIPIEGIEEGEVPTGLDGWTAGLARKVMAGIDSQASAAPPSSLKAALEWSQRNLRRRQTELRQLTAERDRMRLERALPDEQTMELFFRYEAHFVKQLSRARAELEALQSRRLGGHVPVARVEIQGLPES